MELHEFGIGDHRAGARRHAQAFAARFQRIGGDAHRARPGRRWRRSRRGRGTAPAAHPRPMPWRANRPVTRPSSIASSTAWKPSSMRDRRRRQRARRQGAGDFRAGAVALHMHDAGARMGRFAAQRQRAVGVAVERRAQSQQIGDAVGRFARHQIDDAGIAQARAGRHRVGGMVTASRRLRPSPRRCRLAPRRCEPDVPGREPASTRAGKGASFSAVNRPAMPAPRISAPSVSIDIVDGGSCRAQAFTASMRSMATRARAAIGRSTITSWSWSEANAGCRPG